MELGVDYCPICSLQCTCYRCSGRVATLIPQFTTECKEQGLGPREANFNFVWHCSRNLAKLAKRSGDTKVTNVATSTRRKSQGTASVASVGKVEAVAKVPKDDFPAELSSGINKDPSLKDDYNTIFRPEGSSLCKAAMEKAAEAEKEAVSKPVPVVIVEDGNVDYCDICKKIGDLVCCDKCPRGFHGNCLPADTKFLSGRWECPRCLEDSTEQEGDAMKGTFSYDKLSAVYKSFAETRDFKSKVGILSKIFDLIQFVKEYDFGSIFSEAVDCKIVRDYKIYVKRPMDLGTVSANLLKGAYCKAPKRTKDMVGAENASEMDIIILSVLMDIEQVWHNCFLYNREGK